MRQNYLKKSHHPIIPQQNKMCKSCGLYLNQLPATDKKTQSDVFWVGLSAVAFTNEEERVPLSPTTRSGALLVEIERGFSDSITFFKTNLVKCLPLKENKIRYPISKEMENCFPNLNAEIEQFKPKVIFLLGKQVATFVLSKFNITHFHLDEDFEYKGYKVGEVTYIPIHHPSYVLIYKRKNLIKYIGEIRSVVERYCLVIDQTFQ
jgi:uracil-DNA glycosylase family 4